MTATSASAMAGRANRAELRRFLEEVACDLCRLRFAAEAKVEPEAVSVRREVALPRPGCFADIWVEVPGRTPCAVEIKFGYPEEELAGSLIEKYGAGGGADAQVGRILLGVEPSEYPHWADIERSIRAALPPKMEFELWNAASFTDDMERHFGVRPASLLGADVRALRALLDDSKWRLSFGGDSANSSVQSTLLWHYSHWTLMRLRGNGRDNPAEILQPGLYREVVVLMADMCGFSAYVRDTREDDLIRRQLTSFYSKARHAIHDAGGMIYQFIGDAVVGIFGVPEHGAQDARRALDAARALLDIGNSVSYSWQRQLDREQKSRGVHIGLAMGDLNLVPLRPFSRNHIGFIGDAMNMTARLMAVAGPSEIVVSNGLHNRLDAAQRRQFESLPAVEAKNIGQIRCWRLQTPGAQPAAPGSAD